MQCPISLKSWAGCSCSKQDCVYWTDKVYTNCFYDHEITDELLVEFKGLKSKRQLDLMRGEGKNEINRMILVDQYYNWIIENYKVVLDTRLILKYPLDFDRHFWSKTVYDCARNRNVFRAFRKRFKLVGVTLESLLLLNSREIVRMT
jgi:hypothetical protein